MPVACYPNAGLPNAFGGYDETPDVTSSLLREFARRRPGEPGGWLLRHHAEHTAAIAAASRTSRRARSRTFDDRVPTFSGLEPFQIRTDTGS